MNPRKPEYAEIIAKLAEMEAYLKALIPTMQADEEFRYDDTEYVLRVVQASENISYVAEEFFCEDKVF